MDSIFVSDFGPNTGLCDTNSNAIDLLTKNTLTTAGVLVGGSAGVASLALVATALPAQMALATGVSAGLIYAGDREAKGLPINPWQKDDETTTEAAKPAPASKNGKSTKTTAAAAA